MNELAKRQNGKGETASDQRKQRLAGIGRCDQESDEYRKKDPKCGEVQTGEQDHPEQPPIGPLRWEYGRLGC